MASGQNSISQVKNFKDALDLSGVIITKLDSTSKAGFAISVSYDYGLPIKFIGVGEKIEDLIPFNEKEFGEALLNNYEFDLKNKYMRMAINLAKKGINKTGLNPIVGAVLVKNKKGNRKRISFKFWGRSCRNSCYKRCRK